MKLGMSLPFNLIIISIVVLIVLVLVILIFTGYFSGWSKQVKTCDGESGICRPGATGPIACSAANMESIGDRGCSDALGTTGFCCRENYVFV